MMREELAALKPISRLFKNAKDQTNGNALHLVVTTALLHWDKLEPFVFSDQEYCKAEGFAFMEQFRQAALLRKYPDVKPDGRSAGHKGAFFQVCMSKREQSELRELCHDVGLDLRTFMASAIRSRRAECEELRDAAKKSNLSPDRFLEVTCCNREAVCN